jgi:hypothetical protein
MFTFAGKPNRVADVNVVELWLQLVTGASIPIPVGAGIANGKTGGDN